MISADKYERLNQVVKVLDTLRQEKYTRQLLEDLNDFGMHEVLRLCVRRGFVSRVKRKHRIYNMLTARGRGILRKHKDLLAQLESQGAGCMTKTSRCRQFQDEDTLGRSSDGR